MILKETIGPFPKGTQVAPLGSPKKEALHVDPLRFRAWREAGLLEEEPRPKPSRKKKAKGDKA